MLGLAGGGRQITACLIAMLNEAFGHRPEALGTSLKMPITCGNFIQYPCVSRHIPSSVKLKIGLRLGQINIIPKMAISEHCVWLDSMAKK